jgi:hypothetical protein
MYDTDQQSTYDDDLQGKRETLRQLLDEIVGAVSVEMRDAGLDFPVFMTVPNSGESLAGIATPLDPSDEDWDKVRAIVLKTIEQRIDCGRLSARPLRCATATGTISGADVALG